jgi:hypothetical protein
VLIVAFTQSLIDWPDEWLLFFQWAMICLFMMMLFFIFVIFTTLGSTHRGAAGWLKFEVERMDSDTSLTSKERQYKLAFGKFQTALTAFGYDGSQGVRFSAYTAKLVRRNVVALTDLTWVCWVCLATLVVLNTLRAEATTSINQTYWGDENIEDEMSQQQRIVNYISFIVFIGYTTFFLFLGVYYYIWRQLESFLEKKQQRGGVIGATAEDGEGGDVSANLINRDNLEDPRSLLFRRSREATMEIIQVLIVYLEWYVSTFFVSFSGDIAKNFGLQGIPFFVAAIIPVVGVIFMLPWLLNMVTMLSSLGNNLHEEVVRHLILKAGVPESDWPAPMKEAIEREREKEREKEKERQKLNKVSLGGAGGGQSTDRGSSKAGK